MAFREDPEATMNLIEEILQEEAEVTTKEATGEAMWVTSTMRSEASLRIKKNQLPRIKKKLKKKKKVKKVRLKPQKKPDLEGNLKRKRRMKMTTSRPSMITSLTRRELFQRRKLEKWKRSRKPILRRLRPKNKKSQLKKVT